MANFNAEEHISLSYSPTQVTHSNDISMRFKTPKNNGFLLSTSNDQNREFLKVLIEDGRGKVETNLGGQNKVNQRPYNWFNSNNNNNNNNKNKYIYVVPLV